MFQKSKSRIFPEKSQKVIFYSDPHFIQGYFRYFVGIFLSFSIADWVHVEIDMVQEEFALLFCIKGMFLPTTP